MGTMFEFLGQGYLLYSACVPNISEIFAIVYKKKLCANNMSILYNLYIKIHM